jgi:pyruvate dehydrogenase (quinone)
VPAINEEDVKRAVSLINAAGSVTMLVGMGAREAREEVLALAEHLSAPMVLTLKAKEGLERDNPYQIGQSGLIGNPATREAFEARLMEVAAALVVLGRPAWSWIRGRHVC